MLNIFKGANSIPAVITDNFFIDYLVSLSKGQCWEVQMIPRMIRSPNFASSNKIYLLLPLILCEVLATDHFLSIALLEYQNMYFKMGNS